MYTIPCLQGAAFIRPDAAAKSAEGIQRHTFTHVQIFLKFSQWHCCSILQTLPLVSKLWAFGPETVCALAPETQARMTATMAEEKRVMIPISFAQRRF